MKRALAIVVGVAVLAAAIYGIVIVTDDEEVTEEQVIVIDEVGRATLQDTVIVRGSVAREARFALAGVSAQRVTEVGVEVD
ncbi:MAG: hypothetical protein AAFO29_09595, partial [Actinomycetota bacterium]